MSMINDALALCKETEKDAEALRQLSDKLEKLGMEFSWGSPNGCQTLWVHPSVDRFNEKAGILGTYFCDLRRTENELWFTTGRIGNTASFKMSLPEDEHLHCPNCGGDVLHLTLGTEEKLVLKPGRKRRSRVHSRYSGWSCMGHPTDVDVNGCGWEERTSK